MWWCGSLGGQIGWHMAEEKERQARDGRQESL